MLRDYQDLKDRVAEKDQVVPLDLKENEAVGESKVHPGKSEIPDLPERQGLLGPEE